MDEFEIQEEFLKIKGDLVKIYLILTITSGLVLYHTYLLFKESHSRKEKDSK